MLILFRMVDSGMGSWEEVQNLDARTVLQRLYYEKYKSEYEHAWIELNKET